jgi:predicted DNA-binding protein YlxM (UPF0122 family)
MARIRKTKYDLLTNPINEFELIDKHIHDDFTLQQLIDYFKISRKSIKDILTKNNIKITRRNRIKELSTETKEKISKGNKGKRIGTKNKLDSVKKSLIHHMQHDISFEDLAFVTDTNKFSFLSQKISKKVKFYFDTKQKYLDYYYRFYNDPQFNKLYDKWKITKCMEDKPSLDHIVPLSKGGTWELNNLQYLTWFENRCKGQMTNLEWINFKIKNNIKCDIFV